MKRKSRVWGAISAAFVTGPVAFQFLNYQSQLWGLIFLGITVLFGVYAVIEGCSWLVSRARFSLIPLPDAATSLYEMARARGSIWALAAEKLSGPSITGGTPDQVLNWVATWIMGRTEIQGTRPPSKSRETIHERSGIFEEGAQDYRTVGNFFTDLAIRRGDLRRLAREIRNSNGENALRQNLDDVNALQELQSRRDSLSRAERDLIGFMREAKDRFREAETFVRTLNEASPNSPISGTVAMHPEAFKRLTKRIAKAIDVAKETGFASGLEVPKFVPPPDTHLRKTNERGDTVFYKDNNWPYMAELTLFIDRSANAIRKLDGPLFLIREELKANGRKMEEIRARLRDA